MMKNDTATTAAVAEEQQSFFGSILAPDPTPAIAVRVPFGTCAKVSAAVLGTAIVLPVAVGAGSAIRRAIFGV